MTDLCKQFNLTYFTNWYIHAIDLHSIKPDGLLEILWHYESLETIDR
jgi:hypothetical protein